MTCVIDIPNKYMFSEPDGYQPASSRKRRREKNKTKKTGWFLYLIYSLTLRRSYVGISTDPNRRLRQHRREIVGGARATAAATDWEFRIVVGGFIDKSSACRWEKICKLRAIGVDRRRAALILLVSGMCPAGKRMYTVPNNLFIWRE